MLERQLGHKQAVAPLVTPDLAESNGARTVTMRLLDATSGGGRLASGLGGELLARSLSSGGLAGGLLGTGHGWWFASIE